MTMFSLHLFSFLTLLITVLLHPTHAIHVSHHNHHLHRQARHSHTDGTAIRRSPAQIAAFLEGHNTVRAIHGAKPLTWSTSFATLAEKWADACHFRHTDGVLSDNLYGENIVAATGPFPVLTAMSTFIKDAVKFDPAHPQYSHFTQVIWKSTTEVGCASSVCNNLLGPSTGPATLYVCLYNPPGNVVGELEKNVSLLRNHY